MLEMKAAVLPMDEQEWEKLGVQRDGSSLFTIMSIVEGEILEFLDGKGEISLAEILGQLNWPEPVVMISVGGLIREGLVVAKRHDKFVLLTEKN